MIFVRLIYMLLKNKILKIQYLEQSHKKGLENMKQAFIDSNKKRYYLPISDFEYSVDRVHELQKKIIKLRSGMDENNLEKFVLAMRKALNGGRNPDLVRVGFLVEEISLRKEILIHPDIMFDIAALSYIREDEDPAIVDWEIHKQKVEQFRKDSTGGLYDFFYQAGLSKYMPYLEKLENDFDEYLQEAETRMKAMDKHLSDYLGERILSVT